MENIAPLATNGNGSTTVKFANNGLAAGDNDLFAAFIVNLAKAQNDDVKEKPQNAAPSRIEHDDNHAPRTMDTQAAPKPVKTNHSDDNKAADAKANTDDAGQESGNDGEKVIASTSTPPAKKADKAADGQIIPSVDDESPVDSNVISSAVMIESPAVVSKEKVDEDIAQPTVAVSDTADEKINPEAIVIPVAAVAAVVRMAAKVKTKDNDAESSDALLLQAAQEKIALGKPADAKPLATKPSDAEIPVPSATAPALKAETPSDTPTIDILPHPLDTNAKHASKAADISTLGNSVANASATATPMLATAVTQAQHSATKSAASLPNQSNVDGVALMRGTGNAQQAEAGKAAHARAARLPATMLTQVQEQVAVKLRYAAKVGEKSMSMQLRPEELGRVDIKLDFKDNNMVSAKVIADSPLTLDLLQKSRSGLEQALSDAGLKLDGEGLTFDLRQGSGQAFGGNDAERHVWSSHWQDSAPRAIELQPVNAESATVLVADGRVDIHV